MKLKKLHIKNYKSLVDLEIIKPNPFTVFAGPNGAGKSNIFEALEFAISSIIYTDISTRLEPERLENLSRIEVTSDLVNLIENEFGGHNNFLNKRVYKKEFEYVSSFSENVNSTLNIDYSQYPAYFLANMPINPFSKNLNIYKQFYYNFSRLFIDHSDKLLIFKSNIISNRLFTSASNLEKVLKRLLNDNNKLEDMTEYLELFIPGFERVEIYSDNIEGKDSLRIYEKDYNNPFPKKLISDGTYNILCLLTALFQSDEPQFLCIEEPENGLNPYVIQEFVELCRLMCDKDHGHYIWLNTHSQTLVRALKEEELILVDKENGATKIKQFEKGDFHGLKADEAWLTNSLGAGIPW